MRNLSIAALVCLIAVSASVAEQLPAELEWVGIEFTRTDGTADPAKPATPVTEKLFFNFTASTAEKGKLTWGSTQNPSTFDYGSTYALYRIEKQDVAETTLLYKAPSPYKVFAKMNIEKDKTRTVRLVVAQANAAGEPAKDASFSIPASADLAKSLREGIVKALGAKTAREVFQIPTDRTVAVKDKPAQTTTPAPNAPVVPPPAASDPLQAAINNLCTRVKLNDKGEETGRTPQCKASEPVFFYQALKNADKLQDPDKTRLLALREQVLALGDKPWSRADNPKPINLLRKDSIVQQAEASYVVNGDPAIKKALTDAGVTDENQVLADLCDTLRPGGGLYGGSVFQTLQSAADKGSVAVSQGRAEDIASGAGWDKQQLSNKCEQYRRAQNRRDPRTVDMSGQQQQDGNPPRIGTPGNPPGGDVAGGVFHKVDADPPAPPAPPTNPYKDYINGVKFGIWGAVLGFIFGGPVGALVIGAAAAGAGYYMSSYK